MRKLLPVVIATLMIACKKNNDNPNEVNSTDKTFLLQTYLAGKEEIKAGQLAISKTSNAAVKEFGQQIIDGYRMAQSDIVDVANKLNLALTDTVSISTRGSSTLGELSGYSFDTAYIKSRARSQMVMLGIFQNELNNGNNTYVRYYYLNKYIDKVQDYFHKADSLSRAL
jgi:predicted outer membrane protein